MADAVLVAFCTFPHGEVARNVTHELVQRRLVACGNILPKVESIYRWQDKVESGDEVLVIFKLKQERYPEFENVVRSLHPYEVPEVIAFPLSRGLPAYLKWVSQTCS